MFSEREVRELISRESDFLSIVKAIDQRCPIDLLSIRSLVKLTPFIVENHGLKAGVIFFAQSLGHYCKIISLDKREALAAIDEGVRKILAHRSTGEYDEGGFLSAIDDGWQDNLTLRKKLLGNLDNYFFEKESLLV